jgi:hypothetical protein
MMTRWRYPFVHEAEGVTAPQPAAETPAPSPFLLAAAERPDWLEESFYDAEGKGIRVDALGTSYRELRGKMSQKTDALRAEIEASRREGVPEKPEGYELSVPEEVVPAGFEARLPGDDDPLVAETRAVLHELGAKPEQFQRLVGALIKSQVAGLPDIAAEKAKMGEGAPERIAAVDAWLAKSLGEAEYHAVASGMTTAAGILAMEKLMKMAGTTPGVTGGGNGGGGSAIPTKAEAKALMASPDYFHPEKGAEARAKVDAFMAAGGSVRG